MSASPRVLIASTQPPRRRQLASTGCTASTCLRASRFELWPSETEPCGSLDFYSSIRLNRCMASSEKRRFKDELYDQFARLAKAMASGRRLELIDLLAQGPRTVESLAEQTEQSVANTSQHLQVLRQARLVETTRRGNHIHYRLAADHVLRLWTALRITGEARLAEIGSLLQTFMSDRGALQPVSQP